MAKQDLKNIMMMAWQFVRRNGYTMSEAMKCAWRNFKLHKALYKGIVKFYFLKVDGSVREAFGTLKADIVPATLGTGRKSSPLVQTYYDTEKQAWRCFKVANLIKIA